MESGVKGETEGSFLVLHPSAFKSSHITFDSKPHKVYIVFDFDVKEENSVWSLGWEREKQQCCPYKAQTQGFCWWRWDARGCEVQISSQSFTSLIQTESNHLFNKTRPWPSDKNLLSVVTKVNAAMEQKTVLELDSAVQPKHLKAKPPELV